MRSLKSGLFMLAAAGLFGSAIVIGCSADGGSSGVTEDLPTEPKVDDPGNTLPPSQPAKPDDKKDAGKDSGSKKDSGSNDSGPKDAGPPPPTPGTACAVENKIEKKACGKCGEASTVCIAGLWTDYSACEAETGECVPGATVTESCGNCGTVVKTCTQYCAFNSGACQGEPANNCAPGTIENTSAGCPVSTYRNRTCANSCTWGSFSATCAEPNNPNKLTIASTLTGTANGQFTLSAANKMKRPYSCNGTLSGGADYPFVAVEVKNPTAQTATVTLYHQGVNPNAAPQLDTLLWVYKKTLPVTDDASILACDFGVSDSCTTTPANLCQNNTSIGSSFDWAGLSTVTIPPNGKILVYSAGYTDTEVGDFKLWVRTDALN